MDDIAKDLGISKRTIYQHYSDKEAILALVIQNEIMEQKCEMEPRDGDLSQCSELTFLQSGRVIHTITSYCHNIAQLL